MKQHYTYGLLLMFFLTACEEIYTPKVKTIENALVVDARIVSGKDNNYIELYESLSFNDQNYNYNAAEGASVSIMDDQGKKYILTEDNTGHFGVPFQLNQSRKYKIQITYKENVYESSYESVPSLPDLDTVYGIPENKIIVESGTTDVNDFREKPGIQLYADITREKNMPYYRFDGRKVMQYTYNIPVGEVDETMFCWRSLFSRDIFNIAAPPEYSESSDILKHPIWFLEESVKLEPGEGLAGWILILYQHGLSKSSYDYYVDLNNQLGSEGRLFDPLYVQARSNISCTSDKTKLVLGNFEISVIKEHRYFVNYYGSDYGYIIKPIPYFYDIPLSGKQLIIMPDFWEYITKTYPNE